MSKVNNCPFCGTTMLLDNEDGICRHPISNCVLSMNSVERIDGRFDINSWNQRTPPESKGVVLPERREHEKWCNNSMRHDCNCGADEANSMLDEFKRLNPWLKEQ